MEDGEPDRLERLPTGARRARQDSWVQSREQSRVRKPAGSCTIPIVSDTAGSPRAQTKGVGRCVRAAYTLTLMGSDQRLRKGA